MNTRQRQGRGGPDGRHPDDPHGGRAFGHGFSAGQPATPEAGINTAVNDDRPIESPRRSAPESSLNFLETLGRVVMKGFTTMAFVAAAAALPAALLPATAGADSQPTGPARPQVTISDMAVFPNGPAVVGVSILTRYNAFVEAIVSTGGLALNGAYSWWWVVFNHPEFCVDGCGLDDLPVGATPVSNGDPRVEASLLWGGGFVANGTGAAQVAARLDRGTPPGEVRFGPGLRRTKEADIHIVLRSHGPAVAGEAAEQIGSFNGGCTAEEIAAMQCPNANVQFAVHPAP